jgi:hypothetical protein
MSQPLSKLIGEKVTIQSFSPLPNCLDPSPFNDATVIVRNVDGCMLEVSRAGAWDGDGRVWINTGNIKSIVTYG